MINRVGVYHSAKHTAPHKLCLSNSQILFLRTRSGPKVLTHSSLGRSVTGDAVAKYDKSLPFVVAPSRSELTTQRRQAPLAGSITFHTNNAFSKRHSKMKTEFSSKLNYSSQPIWTKCKRSPRVQALSSLGRCAVKVGQGRQVQRQISQSLRSEPKHGSKRSAANRRVKNKSDQNRNSISNSTADFHIPAQDVGI